MQILVVEDSATVARVLSTFLGRAGHRVQLATSAAEALRAAAEDPPDVVLLDMHLPDAHGLDVVAALRRSTTTRNVRVIGLSGSDVPKAERRQLDGFFLKPPPFADLLAAIEALSG